MDLNRTLKIVGIEPIRSLNYVEINSIVQGFAELLVNTFVNQKLNYQEIVAKMFKCNMYLANISEKFGTANYFYKNQAIYYKKESDLKKLDDYIIHECLHYFQDEREKDEKLKRMGLCTFQEFKIYCMALNEAAIQYITSRMMKTAKQQIEYSGIVLNTRSPSYYPLLCNLIEQMVYLVGEDVLVDSVLFSNDRFVYAFIDVAGEIALKEIQANFDILLELKHNKSGDILKQEMLIKQQYEKTQNLILTSYFDGAFSLIDKIEELDEYQKKLENYKQYLGNVDQYRFYEEYRDKQIEKINKKIITLSRKNSKNMLEVVSNNKIILFFRAIRNFLLKGREDYKIK